MSFTAKYYQFSKKINSTMQPPAATVTWTSTLELLEPCSVMYPRIVVRRSNAPYPDEPGSFTKDFYNYCYIEEFSRYYWIKNWTYNDGLWIADLECDVLASFKTQIGSTSLYILRSSAAADGAIRDTYYPMTSDTTKYHQNQVYGLLNDYSEGYIVVNIAGTGTVGASTLFLLNALNDYGELIQDLYLGIDGFQGQDIVERVVQWFGGNPQTLINGAMWVPYASGIGGTASNLVIGSYQTSVAGVVLSDPTTSIPQHTYTIRKHPKAASRGSYLNLAPYSQYYFGIPGAGVMPLDSSRLVNETQIDVDEDLDLVTGSTVMKIKAHSSGQILAMTSRQLGIPIQVEGGNNAQSLINGAISTSFMAASAIATGGTAAIAGAATAGLGTINEAIGGTPTSSSFNGNLLNAITPCWLDTVFYDITDGDNTDLGRPLCKVRTPSTLGGYMVASEGEVSIPGTKDEADKINAYMEGGFFYE